MTGALEAELVAWLGGASDRTIDTACAHVFLSPERALKIKRHEDLGYVDFSTAERRQWALERELEFNRPTAPDIYRAVRRITREADGSLAIEGAGETVDHLLEMRRFDEGAVLSARPDSVDGALAEMLGRTIADFHAAAPLRPAGGLTAISWTVGSNAGLLRDIPALDQGRVETMIALTEAELERQAPLLAHRSATGFARRCHGDLHLGNILLEGGLPVLFDCIEFSDLLSDLDVFYDLAFLIMDLDFRGRRDAGVRALSAYLDEAARSFPAELWDGLTALPLMLATRAAVRAHVSAHSGDPRVAQAYVEAAIAHLAPPPPVLAAVGGLSGSGKSRFARGIAPALGASPGAVILRTDEIRKRLMDVQPLQRLPSQAYAAEITARTYDTMIDNARALLKAGRAVVLDATFIDPALRGRAEALAAECGAPFHGAWLEAPIEVLEARVASRQGDASDATVAVLHDQIARLAEPVTWPKVDTDAPNEVVVKTWLAAHA
ncbi:bifunctional aminoglycoside phosphotransferase/ATP-binding protein [uncultured Phenylobacterium sp.]|uniref:bifunctional aminoglycoside phosphotransferase/ATP-binding protein n=1 Tax=uncultured Phenylobacterium sp. TaxID=349273 RepID=UPI0025D0178A|nr:bifunctional aminoglycoside phosphotransferase/ATP-binding protein [uncultured Phenylobacterium sp.]